MIIREVMNRITFLICIHLDNMYYQYYSTDLKTKKLSKNYLYYKKQL